MSASRWPVLSAIRRVITAPGWIVALWVGPVAVAAAIGFALQAGLELALGSHGFADDGRRLFAIVDTAIDHRAAFGAFGVATIGAAIAGALAWAIVVGAVIVRLTGERDIMDIADRWWTSLPAVIVQSLWHVILRGAIVFAVLVSANALPIAFVWPTLLIAWTTCTLALDRTRVAVVLEGSARFHPGTAARALLDVLRRPWHLLVGIVLALGQLVTLAAIPWLATAQLGNPAVSLVARGLALFALVLGLVRLALAVVTSPGKGVLKRG